MFEKKWFRFLPKRAQKPSGTPSRIQLLVELSFETSAQVAFNESDGRLRIKRFRGTLWQTEFTQVLQATQPIELRTFIYTPHLNKAESVLVSILVDGETACSERFPIPPEADYAGWFRVVFTPE